MWLDHQLQLIFDQFCNGINPTRPTKGFNLVNIMWDRFLEDFERELSSSAVIAHTTLIFNN